MAFFLHDSLHRVLRNTRYAVLQFFALPLLATASAMWLWIPEAHAYQILLAIVYAALVLFACAAVQSATFVAYADDRAGRFWLCCIAVLLWLCVFFALLYLSLGHDDFVFKLTRYLQSKLSSGARQSFLDPGIALLVQVIVFAPAYYFIPLLLMPAGVLCASRGAQGFLRPWLRALSHWQYWLWFILPAVVLATVPHRILSWTPGKTLHAEMTSLILRLIFAWAIVLACWLFAAALAAASMQVEVAGQSTAHPA